MIFTELYDALDFAMCEQDSRKRSFSDYMFNIFYHINKISNIVLNKNELKKHEITTIESSCRIMQDNILLVKDRLKNTNVKKLVLYDKSRKFKNINNPNYIL